MTKTIRIMQNGSVARHGVTEDGPRSIIWLFEGELETLNIDWTDKLASSETISTNTITGATGSEAGGVVAITLTGPSARTEIVNTIDTSVGQKLIHKVDLRRKDSVSTEDYN